MKSPSAESSLKLLHTIHCLMLCPELQSDDVSKETRRLMEATVETSNQVRRECKLPARADLIKFFKEKYADEDQELLVKRVVAMINTFPDETLYSSYEHLHELNGVCEPKPKNGSKKRKKSS